VAAKSKLCQVLHFNHATKAQGAAALGGAGVSGGLSEANHCSLCLFLSYGEHII